jgi:hypothetical protein
MAAKAGQRVGQFPSESIHGSWSLMRKDPIRYTSAHHSAVFSTHRMEGGRGKTAAPLSTTKLFNNSSSTLQIIA